MQVRLLPPLPPSVSARSTSISTTIDFIFQDPLVTQLLNSEHRQNDALNAYAASTAINLSSTRRSARVRAKP
jgi:hypothetical protein